MHRLPLVSTDRLHNFQQIATIAGAGGPATGVVAFVQEIHRAQIEVYAESLAVGRENLFVHLALRRVNLDLVADPPQECVIDQLLRVQVGAEDDELLERHLELLAARHREEVVPVFER